MNENDEIRTFLGNYENAYQCENCPMKQNNAGYDQYPCGQFRCWVCATNGDYENM